MTQIVMPEASIVTFPRKLAKFPHDANKFILNDKGAIVT